MFTRLLTSRRLLAGVAVAAIVTGAGLAIAAGGLGTWRQERAATSAEDWTCPMHPDVHQDHPGRCPICGMTLERTSPATEAEAHGQAHESRAETANPARPGVVPPPHEEAPDPRAPVDIDVRRQQLLGIRVATAETQALSRHVRVPGVVKFDESRWTDVTLRLEGYVRDLYVDRTGQAVRRGQRLFAIYSPDLAAALAEYRLADRARAALPGDASDDLRAQAARLVDAARVRLGRWEVADDQIDKATDTLEPRTVFRSPVSGIVMEKSIVKGMRAMPGEVLYRIVDPSVMWIEASVYEPDLAVVRVGQRGEVAFDAFPGETATARVTYVAPELDGQSRTAVVRFELPNRGGRLKAGMFASVDLDVPLGRGVVVPSDAVLDSGRRQLVFVAEGNGYFTPREVTAGHQADGRTQILKGLSEGDRVAESAAFFIDSESQLRAGAQDYAATRPTRSPALPADRLSIELETKPDPPKAGPVTLTATLEDADGHPVTGAAVSVVFAMAAMPSMNMPAMRSEAALSPSGDGTYRGSIDVLMTGRWDVTVSATKGGQPLGSRHLTVIAR